jgi:hypothetical protein
MRELAVLDWLVETCVERTLRPARSLAATLYVLLATLAGLEVVTPGATERISSQAPGRVLLAVLAGLLCSVAVLGIADVAFRRPRSVLEPGVADSILQFGLACAALEPSMLGPRVSSEAAAISFGVIGFCLICAGMHRLLRNALSTPPGDEWRERKLRSLARRDDWARGVAFTVLGALSIVGAVVGTRTADVSGGLLGIGSYAAGAFALLGYAMHAFWTNGEQDRSWAM